MLRTIVSVLGLIAVLTTPAFASPVNGPASDREVLRPGKGVRYSITLLGGEMTRVVVTSEGGDIGCALFDEGGNAVDADEAGTGQCYLMVTPVWTGDFYLVVLNRGTSAAKIQVEAK